MKDRNPYFRRYVADCLIVFVSLGTTLMYFNFRDHRFYHPGHFGGFYVALLSVSMLIVSAIDLFHTFRLCTRWQKEQRQRSLGSSMKNSANY